jgi:hypothetical protein
MAGYISEFFGYRAEDRSDIALKAAASGLCPFLGSQCSKMLSRDGTVSGVCSIRQKKQRFTERNLLPNPPLRR